MVIGSITGDAVEIDLWLMSCRVLKRDMEYAMMDEFVRICKNKGFSKIIGHYYPTSKNGMVKDFYSLHDFKKISEDENGNTTWEIPIENYKPKNKVIEVNA